MPKLELYITGKHHASAEGILRESSYNEDQFWVEADGDAVYIADDMLRDIVNKKVTILIFVDDNPSSSVAGPDNATAHNAPTQELNS
jgi:hypothetical protein